ncbi:Phage-related protein [Collimonas arenae]|uniref:Phage-related protein n=1 Tax=Collimonas arenae TaxID=279058 RepID=A0A0A1FBC9_9BURK|nr:hypothetical protein [Collimonas arenae]AIY40147.1 Phage-related protein [Collimonas arenae]
MKERPILFTGAMVRALLAGDKTQTRRIVKPQPAVSSAGNLTGEWLRRPLDGLLLPKLQDIAIHCPYGQPGDRLWVRESFWGCDLPGFGDQPCVVYDDEWRGKEYQPAEARPWARKFGRIPSIHMPRDCSRILLEITAVRVERLQSINTEDIIAEGLSTTLREHDAEKDLQNQWCDLWESTGGDWMANPWVWVVEFKRIDGE